jgi:N-acetylgalactosamine kinase
MLKRIQNDFSEEKAEKAFGDLWRRANDRNWEPSAAEVIELVPEELTCFDFLDRTGRQIRLSPGEVDEVRLFNSSVYLAKTQALQFVLDRLDRNNAQREEYLPDMITILSQSRDRDGRDFVVRALSVKDEHAVMAFNNPAELLEIEAYIQARDKKRLAVPLPEGAHFRRISEWLKAFRDAAAGTGDGAELVQEFQQLYGQEKGLLAERFQAYIRLLEFTAAAIKEDEQVLIVRSPGRVNLMGRHVDHQGGNCNLMTIGYETVAVVRPRRDDRICIYNLERS